MGKEKIRAIVTGASGSIGSAIAKELAASGMFVYLHANQNVDPVLRLQEEIEKLGQEAQVITFDVTDREKVAAEMEGIVAEQPLQVIVNNSGIHEDTPMAGMAGDVWDRIIDVSLNGFYNVTRPALMPMIKTRWGRIINITSIAGITGNRGQVNYSAAKSGVHGATKSLALELASRNITVNAVAPGIIESPMIEGTFDRDTIEKIVPMKRAGKPEEVASLVAYLASPESAYITGQVISINGGMF